MSMTVIGGLYSNYAAQNVNDKAKKKEVENNSKKAEATTQNSEVKKPQLSTAAQQLLEKLQKTYNNMDFMVYGNGQDAKELLSQGTKEISVLFSSDELEKMASDEKNQVRNRENALRRQEKKNEPRKRQRIRKRRKNFKVTQKAVQIPRGLLYRQTAWRN